jgi:hypothetical protein
VAFKADGEESLTLTAATLIRERRHCPSSKYTNYRSIDAGRALFGGSSWGALLATNLLFNTLRVN